MKKDRSKQKKAWIGMMLMLCVMMLCSSCDSNKGKVKELTEQFVADVNNGDKASIYDLYPTAKSYDNLQMVVDIKEGDVTVERDDSTLLYTASIDNQRQQKLVFSVDTLGNITLVDSYGILLLDSVSGELALKCGVPIKRISDVEQSKLMNEESLFLSWLKDKHTEAYGSLYASNTSWSCGSNFQGAYCMIHVPVTNSGNQLVHGSEYTVEVKCYSSNNPYGVSLSKSFDGEDIAAGATRSFDFEDVGLYAWARERSLAISASVKYRDNSFVNRLLQYATFTGSEYEEYEKEKESYYVMNKGEDGIARNEKQGHVNCYAEPSEKSQVTGTAYHRQSIRIVPSEAEGWSKAYQYDYDKSAYVRLGYISDKEWVRESESDTLTSLNISEMILVSENDSDIPVYAKADKSGKVLKQMKPKTKVLSAYENDSWDVGFMALYEADGQGGYKIIGYVPIENITEDISYDEDSDDPLGIGV